MLKAFSVSAWHAVLHSEHIIADTETVCHFTKNERRLTFTATQKSSQASSKFMQDVSAPTSKFINLEVMTSSNFSSTENRACHMWTLSFNHTYVE